MHKRTGTILVASAVQQKSLQPRKGNAHLSFLYTNVVDLKEFQLALPYLWSVKLQKGSSECGDGSEGF